MFFIFFICLLQLLHTLSIDKVQEWKHKSFRENLMLVTTIDGYVRAIEPQSGIMKWFFKEDPILKTPTKIQHGFTFLPNPQDGELYFLQDGQIKKLPYSIPQLVSSSPCRTSDGVLYAGNKKDVWIEIDPINGVKLEEISISDQHSQCPINKNFTVFIGRSEYHLSMFDPGNRKRQWNATYTDYSSHLLPPDSSYSYKHLTSTSSGHLVTLDGTLQTILWNLNLGDTINAIYLLQKDGLHKLPYTVIGNEALDDMLKDGWQRNSQIWSGAEDTLINNLYPTLFVGESNFSIYAMPALVDAHTITIVPKAPGPPLIEGAAPIKVEVDSHAASIMSSSRPVAQFDIGTAKLTQKTVEGEFLLLGYHQPPETVQSQLISKWIHFGQKPPFIDFVEKMDNKNAELIKLGDEQNESFVLLSFQTTQALSLLLLTVTVSTFCIVAGCIYLFRKNGQGDISSRLGDCKSAQTSKMFNFGIWTSNTNVEVPDGWVPIGKISYNPDDRLGVGCEGTVVYRGMFDGRQVAVKRVIADFQLAVREVDHLRESDANSNVIRYFCMECDANFHYIALELCEYSLVDYVQNSEAREYCSLSEIDILLQATKGVAHLHSINIVHRDIKPQNVLLSRSQRSGRARALISDFGFCKRLQSGQYSVSHKSGVIGTDGWMAPEAINDCQHMTYAVDVFSLGCVYFYVLTKGIHPFGDVVKRQANILQNEYNLAPLIETKNLVSVALIESMLKSNLRLRPSSNDLISHPFFWTKLRELQFFSDVSDRIEKEEDESCVVVRLEENAFSVIGPNWRKLICGALAEDLRKFRTYRGQSLRDLLRAMRNKKHHYRELPTEVQNSLGVIPDQFITYFTNRFPNLLMHTYDAMACCANEPIFMGYYSESAHHAAQFLMVTHELSDNNTTFSSSSEQNLINSSGKLETNNEEIVDDDDHLKKKRKRRRKNIIRQ